MLIEVRHHPMCGHWLIYGWHVDVLSDRLDDQIPGIQDAQYAAVTNFGCCRVRWKAAFPTTPMAVRFRCLHLTSRRKKGRDGKRSPIRGRLSAVTVASSVEPFGR